MRYDLTQHDEPERNRQAVHLESLHIGQLIRKKLKEEGRSVVWLAQKMQCDPSNIHKIFKKPHIYPESLMRFSLILEHNFFVYYSDCIENSIRQGK